jgi:F0F1-type ATP synthase membrane subunit b/b'
MIEGLGRLGVSWQSLLVYTVNFVLLVAELYLVAYRPFLRVLRERAERISRGLADAEQAQRLKADLERQRAKVLEETADEARRV